LLTEFTGERVIPGQVDEDLWNEHFARYAFTARLARWKRVLDAGCGSGYGSAELARSAATVVAADVSGDAIEYAREHFPLPNLHLIQASCTQLPLPDTSFDLVVALEVIEHLKDWRGLLAESRRLLAPGGQFVVSTPNRDYYRDSRGQSGGNLYHEHEFSFEEFCEELRLVFPYVSMFLQDHAEAFVFQPAKSFSPAEARVEAGADSPEHSHFFVAVCALSPQMGAPTFLYLPRAANILREREQHIEKLDHEVHLKDREVAHLGEERGRLTDMFRAVKDELEERNRWAEQLNQRLEEAAVTIRGLQGELEQQSRGYEAKIAELEQDNRAKTDWAIQTEQRLTEQLAAKCLELAECVEALHKVESTLEERTGWARSLDLQVQDLEGRLGLVRASRWVKIGNAFGVGPRLRND
jgi:SAM-dependent methyltransferase